MPKEFPLSKVYQLLEPGPVVLLTTAHKGASNVMTMSWHTMLDFEPPLVACVVSEGDMSFSAVRATHQCVIAIPSGRDPKQKDPKTIHHCGYGHFVVDGKKIVLESRMPWPLTGFRWPLVSQEPSAQRSPNPFGYKVCAGSSTTPSPW